MKKFIIAGALACCGLVQGWSQVALTTDTPAVSPSPVLVPSSPALAPATVPTGVVTNARLLALSDALVMLQTNLQQTLPLLASFNDNFDFISLGDNGVAATTTSAPQGNFANNLATNFATNLGVNAAVPTGPSLFNTAPNRTTVSAAGLPQGFASVPETREALRALLVLQSDIERMLPVVNALNSGTTNFPGNFTNLFGLTSAIR